jgi:hypothetical protein
MNANMSAVWKAMPSETREALYGLRSYWPFFPVGIIVAAGIIALLNYELHGLHNAFAIGLAKALFYSGAVIGGILSWLFFTGVTWRASIAGEPPKRLRRLSDDDIPKRFWWLGLLITALWLLPLFALTTEAFELG